MIRPGTSVNKNTNVSKLGKINLNLKKKKKVIPSFRDFLVKNDWVGAIAMLDLEKSMRKQETKLWSAYCYFHIGQYEKSVSIYNELIRKQPNNKDLHLYKALCLYGMCQFQEARKEAIKSDESSLHIRLMYHISQKMSDDTSLMSYHHKLGEDEEDQLCLAAIHYLRGHYDDCIDIYKKLLMENKKNLALNVYLALCYYRQEYYEISQDNLQLYLNEHPDSLFATNLKACNLFQIASGKEAEEELLKLEKKYEGGNIYEDNDLLRHNLSVIRNGENALKIFPPLMELYPEAKLNLVIHYLRQGETDQAFKMIHDLEPVSPKEYILKGVVLALYGQKRNSQENIEKAQQMFQLIGTSATECDTVSGRQCIASYLFLKKQFEDVIIYLKTIAEFMGTDDDFNWNYGIALASINKFKDAEEVLSKVQNETYRAEYIFNAWLAKCYIMNEKPELAWNLYLEMDTSNDTLNLLQLIGNETFKMNQYYYSLKAFDILERLDNDDYSNSKVASAVGIFKSFLLSKCSQE